MSFIIDEHSPIQTLQGGQSEFANDWKHRYIALSGGWGSGKTFIGARKLLTLHILNAIADDGNMTYVPSAIVGPTISNLQDFDYPAVSEALDEAGLSWEYKGRVTSGFGDAFYIHDLGTVRNPSCIILRSADHPERITGWQVGAAWGDEPARWKSDFDNPLRDPFTQLMGRVRHQKARFRQLLFTYTNEGNATRVYKEFNAGKPDHALYTARTKDNVTNPMFYEDMIQNLSPELQKQYLEGGAIDVIGCRVYKYFRDSNIESGIDLVPELPLQLSLDFNIEPGMHAVVGQYHQDKDIFVEPYVIHGPRMDVRGIVAKLREIIDSYGGFIWSHLEIFGDATGGSEWSGTGESCYDILREHLDILCNDYIFTYKMRVPRSNPPVVDRVNAVNAAFVDARDRIHLEVHPRCEVLINDFRDMNYDDRGEIDKRDRKRSHASDALGYKVWYLRPIRKPKTVIRGRFNV